jgi:hypothetical protein
MSETLDRVRILVASGRARVSDHGYEQLAEDGILARDAFAGVATALVVEDYPDAAHGPSVLVLQNDSDGRPLHILWGIPAGHAGPAVVVTGYRPDPSRWSEDYVRRKPK